MAKLPSISSQTVVKAFKALGWQVARQRSSYIILVREVHEATFPSQTVIRWLKEPCEALFVQQD